MFFVGNGWGELARSFNGKFLRVVRLFGIVDLGLVAFDQLRSDHCIRVC